VYTIHKVKKEARVLSRTSYQGGVSARTGGRTDIPVTHSLTYLLECCCVYLVHPKFYFCIWQQNIAGEEKGTTHVQTKMIRWTCGTKLKDEMRQRLGNWNKCAAM